MSELQKGTRVSSGESTAGHQEIGKSGTGCKIHNIAGGRRAFGVQLAALLFLVFFGTVPLAAQTPSGFTVVNFHESVLVAFETSEGLVSGTVREGMGSEGYHQVILFKAGDDDVSLLVKGSGSGTASLGSGSGTASLGSGSGTASLGSGSGTASLGSGSGTASLGSGSGTASLGSGSGTTSLGSGSGTASLGSGSGTASLGSGSGTASECDDFGILVKGSGSGAASIGCAFDHPNAWGFAEVAIRNDNVSVIVHQVINGAAVEYATVEL